MSSNRNVMARAAVFAALLPAVSQSQTSSALADRSSFSVAVIQSRPQGALARNIDLGYGANGAYEFRITSILGLRADLGVVAYGNESKRTALSETVGGRIQVNVRTTNYIMPMSIGPQIMWPTGAIRPYVNAGVGSQAFFTESHVESTDDLTPFASTTNQSDFAPSWTLGGGIYIPVAAGNRKVQLDLGAQYSSGGSARYLAPGSIVDLPAGKVSISPMESATHLVVVRLGARIGL
jgi:outer membrane protein with beta-barrel domain